MYLILGEYQGDTEVIDHAEDENEAEYMMNEYQLAYGNRWYVYYEREKDAEKRAVALD